MEDGNQELNAQATESQEPFSQNSADTSDNAQSEDSVRQDEQTPAPADENQPSEIGESLPLPEYYTVESGDSLSSISLKFYGTKSMISRIMEENGIEDADLIYSGEKILIPAE